MRNLNLSKAYSSQYDEKTLDNLLIDGAVPTWLSGRFVSNGPGQFEVVDHHFTHWFDGFSMLKKFDFNAGKVRFQNRFLQSTEYVESNKIGRLSINEFGTYARNSTRGRLLSSLKELIKGSTHDNCVVNTTRIAGHYIAMTESTDIISFNINNLSTNGAFDFTDNIPGHVTTAHPHFDINTHELINISIEVGRITKYHIYKIEPLTKTRKIIQTYLSNKVFYIHSFSITNNYIILFKSPLILNKMKLMLGLPFNNALSYQENVSSFFVVIDRRNGKTYEIETDPFICLHNVNAYEHDDQIVLELVCHSSWNPYDNLYLSNLCSVKPTLPAGEIRRYSINIHSHSLEKTIISNRSHEFPRINYKTCNGNPYQFVYTVVIKNPGDLFFNEIEKLNTQTGSSDSWSRPYYYVGEAVFVPRTDGQDEDDGVLLSIAFNAVTQLSSLIIIEAVSMQLLAEIHLPFCLPFGLHGNFYTTN